MALETAKSNLQAFVDTANIKVHAATAGGNVYAAYVSSALNTINTVMQLGSLAETTETKTVT